MNITRKTFLQLWDYFHALPPTEPPDVWAENNFVFNEEQIKGKCDFTGRNYLRRIIRDNNNPKMREQTIVTGTGVGKTISFIIGICWKILFAPVRGLWVMPTSKGEGGSGTFVDTRLIPDIEATPAMAALMPDGQRRFKVNKQHVRLGGAHFGFVGGNSATQVAGNRCGDIRMDETDKFPQKLKNEAGTGALVKNRTEGVENFQIFDSSTPTVENGIIWPRLQRSNLHLYFVPCPHCNGGAHGDTEEKRGVEILAAKFKGWFAYAWSEQFKNGLPINTADGTPIPYALVKWDPAAKARDGVWNYAKVQDSAHTECPHCKGKIFDWIDDKIQTAQKEWMDASGAWVCVKSGVPGHFGYHASSLYAPVINKESTLGGRAVKFLSACESGGEDVRDFINSTLALPEIGQAQGLHSVRFTSQPIAGEDWVAQLTCDFQKNFPYIWFVARKWCAFKLLPPFEMINGKPDFYELLKHPGNEVALKQAESLAGGVAWGAVAELMRFDSRTGVSPLVDFLIQKKIVGEKLLNMFDEGGKRTMEFRAAIYKAMGVKQPPRGGDSELVACGHCALSGDYVWDELKELIQEFKIGKGMPIPGRCVGIDTGYAEKFNREVLRKCFESASEFKFYDPMSRNRPPIFYQKPIHSFCQPCSKDGWFGMKGYPLNKRWNHGGIMNELNLNLDDPFYGTPKAGQSVAEVLEFPAALFWLRKDDIRKHRTKLTYVASQEIKFYPSETFKLAEYERHLNVLYFDADKSRVVPRGGEGGSQARRRPYHLDDCENMQIALATHHEFFESEEKSK